MKKVLVAALLLFVVIGCSKKPQEVIKSSGLRYADDTVGTGREAKVGDLVSIHFRGWIIKDSNNLYTDWSKDSTRMMYSLGDSRERNNPFKFVLNTDGFVKGSDEGIIGMKKGGTRTIIIPSRLAYGAQGFGPIPPNSNLKIVVTLMDVKDKIQAKMWDVDTTKALITKSGLKYVIVNPGSGPDADSGKTLVVHYTGFLANGNKFDSSVERDEPFTLMLGMGMVIPGWEEGLRHLKKGSKARLIVPASLGYGNRQVGVIPPNSTLYFDVEVIDIR